jgi:hypothetical protein
LQSSFALASSMMLGSSASGRPVAGSWFLGASRVSGSGSDQRVGSSTQARSGITNIQKNLPIRNGKTQQSNFSVQLPRSLSGVPLPNPTWPVPAPAKLPAQPRRALKTEKASV